MLLIQFSTMVIDRALYLRKTVLGKLAFQVVLVLAIHLWMFFVLPAVTERQVLWAAGTPRGLVCLGTQKSPRMAAAAGGVQGSGLLDSVSDGMPPLPPHPRMFSQNAVAQLWYFVKCIYFALSAYQIRCGYPTRILGNFLTKKYNHLNLFLFQG
jgi:hypothetical protein